MNVLKGKRGRGALLGIKAHRNPLDGPNIVYGTFLVKICQGDMAAGLINLDGRDRRGDLLDQRQFFLPDILPVI